MTGIFYSRKIKCSLACAWLLFTFGAGAQPSLLGIRTPPNDDLVFIQPDGREAFRVNGKYYFPSWTNAGERAGFQEFASQHNRSYAQFQEFPIVLKSDATGFALFDKSGANPNPPGFDYSQIGQFSEGFAPARVNRNKPGTPSCLYLGKQGKPAFGDQTYYRIQPFSNGRAAVQADGPEGPWHLIDVAGQIRHTFPEALWSRIDQVGPLLHNCRMVKLRQPKGFDHTEFIHRYLFLDKDGNQIFELADILPGKLNLHLMSDEFTDGICHAIYESETPEDCIGIAYFDTTGHIIYQNDCVLRASSFAYGHAFISVKDTAAGKELTYLIQFDGTTKPFLPDGSDMATLAVETEYGRWEMLEVAQSDLRKFTPMLTDRQIGLFASRTDEPVAFARAAEFGQYIQFVEYKTGHNYPTQVLRDRKTLRQVFASAKGILAIAGESVLLMDPISPTKTKADELVRFDGKLFWGRVKKDKFYSGIEEALRYPGQVKVLTLGHDEGLENIRKLPQLEILVVQQVTTHGISSDFFIGNPKLSTLSLYNCRNLETLPVLNTVQTLTIQGAPNIRNLERVIEGSARLKSVQIIDSARASSTFLQEIKQKRPDLQIKFSSLQYEFLEEPPAKH